MGEQNECPQCGKALTPSAPRGLCPNCLLKAGLCGDAAGGGETSGSLKWQPPTVQTVGDSFPHLDAIELIGRGGMGAVYKAREKHLDRLVAIKILPPEIGRDPAFARRFTREAQAMAKLNHPNIVTIHSFGKRDDFCFFIMEYVDGPSLGQLLRAGRIAQKEALAIMEQICDAIGHAHDHGIIHCDIKPQNILLTRRGQVKIADFGLSRLAGAPVRNKTIAPNKVMGTPDYMAPEQRLRPGEIDNRADIYSLGVVFYHMLTGELPAGQYQPPSNKAPIDLELDEVVEKALQADPQLRYQKVSELKTQVETIARGQAVAAMPEEEVVLRPLDADVAGMSSTIKRKTTLVAAGAGVVVVLLLAIGVIIQLHGKHEVPDDNAMAARQSPRGDATPIDPLGHGREGQGATGPAAVAPQGQTPDVDKPAGQPSGDDMACSYPQELVEAAMKLPATAPVAALPAPQPAVADAAPAATQEAQGPASPATKPAVQTITIAAVPAQAPGPSSRPVHRRPRSEPVPPELPVPPVAPVAPVAPVPPVAPAPRAVPGQFTEVTAIVSFYESASQDFPAAAMDARIKEEFLKHGLKLSEDFGGASNRFLSEMLRGQLAEGAKIAQGMNADVIIWFTEDRSARPHPVGKTGVFGPSSNASTVTMKMVDVKSGLLIGTDTFNLDSALAKGGAIKPVADSVVFAAIYESARRIWNVGHPVREAPKAAPAHGPAAGQPGAGPTEFAQSKVVVAMQGGSYGVSVGLEAKIEQEFLKAGITVVQSPEPGGVVSCMGRGQLTQAAQAGKAAGADFVIWFACNDRSHFNRESSPMTMTIVDVENGLVIGADAFNIDSAIAPVGADKPVGDSPVFPAICESARKFWNLRQGIVDHPKAASRPAGPKGDAASQPAAADEPEYPPLSINQLTFTMRSQSGAPPVGPGANMRESKTSTISINRDGTVTVTESKSTVGPGTYKTRSLAITKDELKKLLAALGAVDWPNISAPPDVAAQNGVRLELSTYGKGATSVTLSYDNKTRTPAGVDKLFQLLSTMYTDHAVAPWDRER
jgi:tRNA A-37 threonylcarbamoyl transferase component Bud32